MAAKNTSMKYALRITSAILRALLNIVFYILVIVIIISVGKKVYDFSYQLYGDVSVDESPGRDVVFQIKKGESTMDVAKKLQLNRLIVDQYSFYTKAKLEKQVIMPGVYELNSSMSYEKIFAVITDYSASIIKVDEAEPENDTKTKSNSETNSESGSEAKTETETKTE